jgi:tetratricopeptide (TPR) repeat protein
MRRRSENIRRRAMLTLEDVKKAVLDSIELRNSGRVPEAIELLNNRIEVAKQNGASWQVKTLAMHASVLSESVGDIKAAKSYLEEILIYEPENALAIFGIANILKKQGRSNEAQHMATQSYLISVKSNSVEARGLQELIIEVWPDIGRGTE